MPVSTRWRNNNFANEKKKRKTDYLIGTQIDEGNALRLNGPLDLSFLKIKNYNSVREFFSFRLIPIKDLVIY